MAETELVTARFLRQAEEERQARLEAEAAAQSAEIEEQSSQPPARESWSSERLMRRDLLRHRRRRSHLSSRSDNSVRRFDGIQETREPARLVAPLRRRKLGPNVR